MVRRSKFDKVPKAKSRVKKRQVREIWSKQLEHKQVPKRGTEPGVRKGKRSLLACHSRCKCSIETNSVKVKLDIKVMKWVESLIGWEVTVTGRGSEYHLTFVRRRLHIAEYSAINFRRTKTRDWQTNGCSSITKGLSMRLIKMYWYTNGRYGNLFWWLTI